MDTTHHDRPHPRVKTYVAVAAWLALITAIEIVISYIDFADWIRIVSLVVLSLIKFSVVVGYFMHLKFDNPTLRKPFVGGLILAGSVYTIVLLAFTLHSNGPAS